MEMEQGKDRKTYLEILRVLACLFVLYNHTAGRYMRLMEGAGGAAALFLFYVSKTAVPLFLMISGAALLGKQDAYGKNAKRILRMLGVLAVVSLFYYGMNALVNGTPFVLKEFLLQIYTTQATTSLWYLYLYLGSSVVINAFCLNFSLIYSTKYAINKSRSSLAKWYFAYY